MARATVRISRGVVISILLLAFETELAQGILVVAPVFGHLHAQLEEDLLAAHVLDLLARGGADLFKHLAAFADDDALLRIALDEQRSPDVSLVFAALGELVD